MDDPVSSDSPNARLAQMKATDLFAILSSRFSLRRSLVIRLDGDPRFPGGEIFISVESVETGSRFWADMRDLTVIESEMEVLAWAAI